MKIQIRINNAYIHLRGSRDFRMPWTFYYQKLTDYKKFRKYNRIKLRELVLMDAADDYEELMGLEADR